MCSMLGSSVGIGLDFTTCCFWLSLFTIFLLIFKRGKKNLFLVSVMNSVCFLLSLFFGAVM